jgi:hypothetical protein
MMTRLITVWLSIVCIVATAAAQTPTNPLVDELSGRASGQSRDAAQLAAAYEQVLTELVPKSAADDPAERQAAMLAIERIANHAGRPGAESERVALVAAISKRLTPETPTTARIWLLRRLETIGGAECVSAIAGCTNEADPVLRDAARRALEHNPSTDAMQVLATAQSGASDPAWRAALLNSLALRDPAPVAVFGPLAQDDDDQIALAAIHGMATCRDQQATMPLFYLAKVSDLPRKRQMAVQTSLLRLAEEYHAASDGATAIRIYKLLAAGPTFPPLRAAVLRGRAVAEDEKMLGDLLNLVCSQDAEFLRKTAARLMAELKGASVTGRIVARTLKTEPAYMPLLLEALADRGDTVALPDVEVVLAARSETPVRIAALTALGKLGGAAQVSTLSRAAAEGDEAVRSAARTALDMLRGADVDERMIATLEGAPAPVQAELIRSLSARGCKAALDTYFRLAEHTDDAVATAALDALAAHASERDLARMVQLLTRMRPALRDKAEDSTARVALKDANISSRAEPVLVALNGAIAADLPSLIRVAGRLGGSQAFQTIHALANAERTPVADAALRALAEWQDVEAIPVLRQIAGTSEFDATHRILAVRGFVRLIRKPSDRPAEETLALLIEAMGLTTRPDESKQVLGGFGELALPGALERTRVYLKDANLADEAATATVAIARRLAATQRQAALDAIAEVQSAAVGEGRKMAATEALEFIEKHAGYLAAWEYAGPYSQDGKKTADLYEIAFPPEPGAAALPAGAAGPAAPEWKPLTCHSTGDPWIFDLTTIDKGASRCLYVRATFTSETEQPARLLLGSDDGIAAWLNGQSIHTNKASRSVKLDDDKVDVTLKAGANSLLLKVVQSDGGWGFCCGIRGRDDRPLSNVK